MGPLHQNPSGETYALLGDACVSFDDNCIAGLEPSYDAIEEKLTQSLMLVTALNTKIGYDKLSETARKAYKENSTLKEAGVALGHLTADEFDEWGRPEDMIGGLKLRC